jgi:uncharacterized protein (UPF0264 family)
MTQFLISVTSVDEAQIALQNGADIIDLKNPEQGALGALPLEVVAEIVAFVNAKDASERKIISATIGDLPMEPELLLQHVVALSETKVDIIKIGFFVDTGVQLTDYQACLDMLSTVSESGVRLIAVLFVEYDYPANLVMAIKNAGFYGVMFDTVGKNGATFLDYYSTDAMKEIAQSVQAQGLLFGLAGSLNLQHVAMVKSIVPDYMGFRGGVCINNQRRSALDSEKIRAISAAL